MFPRVFVFKLFTKGAYHTDPEARQRAMRGTVTSYEMNVQDMAAMVSGNLLPHKPAVLASVITVTFVSAGPLPKKWLKTTFRVRRAEVGRALEIMQMNQRHYREVQIDMGRMQVLLEDDVPEELIAGIRQCTNPGLAAQESDGYVPEDDVDADRGLGAGRGVVGEWRWSLGSTRSWLLLILLMSPAPLPGLNQSMSDHQGGCQNHVWRQSDLPRSYRCRV